ncbi:formimidoylglutamate deiminase [Marinigracilibium pacificum]|uniref:Formimidoylglutamate deiminase n=1 Tax=Marinigracilibium pacificum TaxID=2729599 RepID=A0A848J5F8_9BACT|nr:formimidoylglutamate deiminase [Marinigracilibium pacificum]NMM48382.1 formimidoylglutamate deiminase [Marinigracilibium pacificum]
MKNFYIPKLITENGPESTYLSLDNEGNIIHLSNEAKADINYETINGIVLPGVPNSHSHAFQYAMAGLAEVQTRDQSDDFWSWRNSMYSLASKLQPEDLEAIAAQLYADMVTRGYTHVVEFHYLHRQPDGTPYEDNAVMGRSLIRAAKTAGIGITIMPVYYRLGNFGTASSEGQKRFISNNFETYEKLVLDTIDVINEENYGSIAIAAHSLRAVDEQDLHDLTSLREKLDCPIHIHIAEQLKEIKDCFEFHKKRPVEYLLSLGICDNNWNFVHATHLTEEETIQLANQKVNAVICPSTEGNLGDGIFNMKLYLENNGRLCIGSDSHIGLSPFEDMRWLDYVQRLVTHQRNTFNTGLRSEMFHNSIIEGRKSAGIDSSKYFEVGNSFDAVVFDQNHPLVASSSNKNLLSTLLYSDSTIKIKDVYKSGEKIVEESNHIKKEEISTRALKTLEKTGLR